MSNFNVTIDETNNQVTVLGDGTQILLVSQGVQGPAGTTDHGALSGLSDDDHSQYHNNSRADTWLSTKSTTNLSEGTNLYFTDARAKSAAVADAINDGTIDIAPSQNAVFDALALKQPLDAQLTDLAALSYAGNASKAIRVNAGETGFELYTPSAGVTDHTLLSNIGTNSHTQIDSHIGSTSNPHSVTASQVGLGNVDNTSDLNKPISTSTQTALDLKVDENAAITGATKTKITYDAKGLVTSGADATTADIAASTDKNYVTDAQLIIIGNTSGTNTGDQDLSSYTTTSASQSYADGKVADAINNGITTIAPSQNAVFDALALKYDASNPSSYVDASGARTAAVNDTAYDATSWNGVTDVAPSKNAVRDQIETILTSIAAKMPISGGVFTGAVVESVVTLTDAATIAVDATLGNIFTVTLGGNRTLGNPTGAVNGQKLIFRVRQDGTGSRTLSYDTKFRFGGDISSINLTTTAAKTDYIGVIYHSADDKFDVIAVNKGF